MTQEDPPRGRLRLAVVLLLLTWPMGSPMVVASASASPWIGVRSAAFLGTASYASSWLLFGFATWLGGAELASRAADAAPWRRWIRRSPDR